MVERPAVNRGKQIDLLKWAVSGKWVFDDPSTDPEVLPSPTGWRVLIRPLQISKKTTGGILLTDNTQNDAEWDITVGRVVAMGPMAYKREDMGPAPWCEVGDYVLYAKYAGYKMTYDGVTLMLHNDDAVMMKVPNPELLFGEAKEETLEG